MKHFRSGGRLARRSPGSVVVTLTPAASAGRALRQFRRQEPTGYGW
jgi:hypothetical protein